MDLKKLFKMQKELDKRIRKEHNLHDKSLINDKIVALIVELSELSNEVRFFKFWSNKGPSHRNIILEEYIDALHFILSIGVETGADALIEDNLNIKQCTKQNLTDEFMQIVKLIVDFKEFTLYQNYKNILTRYLSLGNFLGFSDEEIIQGYILKNNINHERQNKGY